ncbi:MAG: hypothetical protein ACRC18_06605 [Cetobacterium sp.]
MNARLLKRSIRELGYTTSEIDTIEELDCTYFKATKDNTTYEIIKKLYHNDFEIRQLSNGFANTVYKCINTLDCLSYLS